MESCDYEEYNIIYLKKEYLPGRIMAYYEPIDTMWDLWTFHGVIAIDRGRTWKRAFFINVMIHELGHALAIPHAEDHENRNFNLSEFMIPAGFGCSDYERNICNFRNYDFETFIAPFPGMKTTRENLRIREEERIRLLKHVNEICKGDLICFKDIMGG